VHFGGVLVGVFFSLPSILRWRKRARTAQKELNKTNAEMVKLQSEEREKVMVEKTKGQNKTPA